MWKHKDEVQHRENHDADNHHDAPFLRAQVHFVEDARHSLSLRLSSQGNVQKYCWPCMRMFGGLTLLKSGWFFVVLLRSFSLKSYTPCSPEALPCSVSFLRSNTMESNV